MMSISVIVPAFNEGEAVREAYTAITATLQKELPQWRTEIVFVDDGSSDDTFEHLLSLAEQDSSVQVLKLTRNCGSHAAIRAGLESARCDYACFLPCDLQEPPSLIHQMLTAMK